MYFVGTTVIIIFMTNDHQGDEKNISCLSSFSWREKERIEKDFAWNCIVLKESEKELQRDRVESRGRLKNANQTNQLLPDDVQSVQFREALYSDLEFLFLTNSNPLPSYFSCPFICWICRVINIPGHSWRQEKKIEKERMESLIFCFFNI